MSEDSKAPLTDAEVFTVHRWGYEEGMGDQVVKAQFARKLERQLRAARQVIREDLSDAYLPEWRGLDDE